MYCYFVHGLNIQSEIELPSFVSKSPDVCAHNLCDVIIRREGAPPPCPEYNDETQFFSRIDMQEALLYHKLIGAVFVKNGCEVIVYPTVNADKWLIQLFLINTVMAITLYQRQKLVLHGSAILISGAAVAFLGTSGAGKSTMAAALLARGHELISDDVIPVDLDSVPPRALPGFPMLKMDKLTAVSVNINPDSIASLPVGKQKFGSLTLNQFKSEPVVLGHIFILQQDETRKIERVGPQQAFLDLIRNSPPTMWNLPPDAGHTKRCAKLVNTVPISSFSREFGREALLDHARMIEDFLEKDHHHQAARRIQKS